MAASKGKMIFSSGPQTVKGAKKSKAGKKGMSMKPKAAPRGRGY